MYHWQEDDILHRHTHTAVENDVFKLVFYDSMGMYIIGKSFKKHKGNIDVGLSQFHKTIKAQKGGWQAYILYIP